MEKYERELLSLKKSFYEYKDNLNILIANTRDKCVRKIITKNKYYNHTPYYHEIICGKYKSKILKETVKSVDCYIYYFDIYDRIILVENYACVTDSFRICELYVYNDNGAERLFFSSGILCRLDKFDHPFGKTELCLSYADGNGYQESEYVYEGDRLVLIVNSHGKEVGDNRVYYYNFTYENDEILQIQMVSKTNGYRRLCYTSEKPDFGIISHTVHSELSKLIKNQGSFMSIGIEGFIDQSLPEMYICFSNEEEPEELIADWKTDMKKIPLYKCQLTDAQEKKCVKLISEILVELVDEGLLEGKHIYFHQYQVPVNKYYAGARSVFKKAGITIK